MTEYDPLMIGDFIEILGLKIFGTVQAVKPSPLGPDGSVIVDLQECPEDEAVNQSYLLRPDQYALVDWLIY